MAGLVAAEPGGFGGGVEGGWLDGDELVLLKKGGAREAGQDRVDVAIVIREMDGVRRDVEMDDAELMKSVNGFGEGVDEGVELCGAEFGLRLSPGSQAQRWGRGVHFDAEAFAGVGGLRLLEGCELLGSQNLPYAGAEGIVIAASEELQGFVGIRTVRLPCVEGAFRGRGDFIDLVRALPELTDRGERERLLDRGALRG